MYNKGKETAEQFHNGAAIQTIYHFGNVVWELVSAFLFFEDGYHGIFEDGYMDKCEDQ